MSIASEIERLSGVRSDIFTSITNKGVTVPVGSTFSSCPSLIDQIEGGGGGPATSMINSGFTASGYTSGYRPFTATQNEVPQYDEMEGTCISGKTRDINFIQVPLSALSGASNLENYNLNLNFQNWNYDSNRGISIIPDSANVYANQYHTNKSTNDFTQSGSYSPPLFYLNFSQADFISYWNDIKAQPWIAVAYTGEYVYIGWQGYQPLQNMKGDWSYLVQTGTDITYPTYPTTTTGYITNEISGKESFIGSTTKVPNIYVSGFNNVVYEDSPEGGATAISPVNMNLTAFSSNMLKNNITAKTNYNVESTAYSYQYGTTQTAYSGFEGV